MIGLLMQLLKFVLMYYTKLDDSFVYIPHIDIMRMGIKRMDMLCEDHIWRVHMERKVTQCKLQEISKSTVSINKPQHWSLH